MVRRALANQMTNPQGKATATNAKQSYIPNAYHDRGSMLQKAQTYPVYGHRQSALPQRTPQERYEAFETDFEEDMSDFEEYSGRRSEDSVCRCIMMDTSSFC